MANSSAYEPTYLPYAEALRQALVEDPFYTTIVETAGSGEAGKQALLKYLDYSIVEGERYGQSFFPEKEAYGVSVWSKPVPADLAAEQKRNKRRFLRDHIGDTYLEQYEAITGFMSEQSASLIHDSAWYLSIIGVLPDFQNRGLGGYLIRDVLATTDSLRVPTFLETFTPRNETFYQRLGYRVIARPFEPTLQSRYAIMVRDPPSV